jgi:hypothetical protein
MEKAIKAGILRGGRRGSAPPLDPSVAFVADAIDGYVLVRRPVGNPKSKV